MYDFNTCTGALAYPAETLLESGVDDWYDDKKLKGATKVVAGYVIDTALYASFIIGASLLVGLAQVTISSKFHK